MKEKEQGPPTLYEWVGGSPQIQEMIRVFYEKVLQDEILEPLFRHMDPEHSKHVASFISEVFKGPKEYSEKRGGHAHMLKQHFNRKLTEAQRKRWMNLLLESADETELPDDPEFRSSFVAYIEWGTRLAVINSQPGAEADTEAPMPEWGWGETGGPYQGN